VSRNLGAKEPGVATVDAFKRCVDF